MKNKRWEMPLFSFYDRTGMERYLEKRARQGWLLEKMSGLGWTFRRIPLRPLTFTVSYYDQTSLYEPEPSERRQIFRDFCEHAGWRLAAASPWLQVFYNDQPDPVPIETDPKLELASIHRAGKKVLPAYILTILLGFWLGGSWVWQFLHDPLDLLVDPGWASVGLMFGGLFLYLTLDLIGYARWRRRATRAAERGEFLPTKGPHRLYYFLLFLAAAAFLYWLVTVTKSGLRGFMLAYLAVIAALSALAAWMRCTLQRRRISAELNRAATLTVSIALSLILFSGLFGGLFLALRNGWILVDEDVHTSATYEWNGRTFVAYDDPLRLMVEDLTGKAADGYSRHREIEGSLLLRREEGEQRERYDAAADLPGLEYTRYTTRFSAIYALCLNEFLHDPDDWNLPGTPSEQWVQYRPTDAAVWGAQNAWQLFMGSEPINRYVLTWPGCLVQLRTDWPLDDDQKKTAGDALCP